MLSEQYYHRVPAIIEYLLSSSTRYHRVPAIIKYFIFYWTTSTRFKGNMSNLSDWTRVFIVAEADVSGPWSALSFSNSVSLRVLCWMRLSWSGFPSRGSAKSIRWYVSEWLHTSKLPKRRKRAGAAFFKCGHPIFLLCLRNRALREAITNTTGFALCSGLDWSNPFHKSSQRCSQAPACSTSTSSI